MSLGVFLVCGLLVEVSEEGMAVNLQLLVLNTNTQTLWAYLREKSAEI